MEVTKEAVQISKKGVGLEPREMSFNPISAGHLSQDTLTCQVPMFSSAKE